MKPAKVCCFCLRWSSGGIESFLNNCLLNMDLTDIEVDIVACRIEQSVFTQKLAEKGVCFYQLSGKLWAIFKNGAMLKKLFAKRHYTAVHFNLYEGLSLYYCLIAKRMGIKTRIVHAHQSGLRKSLLRPIKLAIHKIASLLLAGCSLQSSSSPPFLSARRISTSEPLPRKLFTSSTLLGGSP